MCLQSLKKSRTWRFWQKSEFWMNLNFEFQGMNPSTNLWIFFICSHFFQDWQVHPVGHVGACKKETTSTKTTAEQKGIYFKFPSSGTCTMPSSSAMMLCSSWGERGEGDVQQHLFMHSFIHLILFPWFDIGGQTSRQRCRTSCCASSSFFFFHSGIRSSSQLSSLLVNMKSSSLRMNTSARTWSGRVTAWRPHYWLVYIYFSDETKTY